MSSNIRINRICQECGESFVAKTTVTKYCSDRCAKRAYKARKRAEKVQASEEETRETIQQSIVELQAKDFLSIQDICQLFNVSRTTIWRMCKDGKLKSVKIGRRKFISRASIDKLFE